MEKIKELRLAKNMSQKELAEVLDCNQTAVGKYERGQLEPNITTLNQLADFFGCSIDYLVGREDDFGNVPVKSNLSAQEQELLSAFSKLDVVQRETVLIQIKAVAKVNA